MAGRQLWMAQLLILMGLTTLLKLACHFDYVKSFVQHTAATRTLKRGAPIGLDLFYPLLALIMLPLSTQSKQLITSANIETILPSINEQGVVVCCDNVIKNYA